MTCKDATIVTKYIEQQHQASFIHWTTLQTIQIEGIAAAGRKIRDFIFAVPNGAKRSKGECYRLKSEGLTAGIPDLFFHLPIRGYSGLFIEFKRPESRGWGKGKTSLAQRRKMKDLNQAGYMAVVAYGVDHAIELILDYLYDHGGSSYGAKSSKKKTYSKQNQKG